MRTLQAAAFAALAFAAAPPFAAAVDPASHGPAVLKPDAFKHHVDSFNAMGPEDVVNHVRDADSWAWVRENAPLFECPDPAFERVYYFRWWAYRKHVK